MPPSQINLHNLASHDGRPSIMDAALGQVVKNVARLQYRHRKLIFVTGFFTLPLTEMLVICARMKVPVISMPTVSKNPISQFF